MLAFAIWRSPFNSALRYSTFIIGGYLQIARRYKGLILFPYGEKTHLILHAVAGFAWAVGWRFPDKYASNASTVTRYLRPTRALGTAPDEISLRMAVSVRQVCGSDSRKHAAALRIVHVRIKSTPPKGEMLSGHISESIAFLQPDHSTEYMDIASTRWRTICGQYLEIYGTVSGHALFAASRERIQLHQFYNRVIFDPPHSAGGDPQLLGTCFLGISFKIE